MPLIFAIILLAIMGAAFSWTLALQYAGLAIGLSLGAMFLVLAYRAWRHP